MSVNIVFIESNRAFLVLLSFGLYIFHRATSSYSNNSMEAKTRHFICIISSFIRLLSLFYLIPLKKQIINQT